MSKLLIKRGTLAQVESAKAAGQLGEGEPYLITDSLRLAIGTGSNNYEAMAKRSETGAYGLGFGYVNGELIADDIAGYTFSLSDGALNITSDNLAIGGGVSAGLSIQATSDLSANKVICFENGVLTYATTDTTSRVLGFSQSSVLSGSNVSIQNTGELDGFSSLTVSNYIYLSTNGDITQVTPTSGRLQILGIALTATKIFIDIQPPLFLT